MRANTEDKPNMLLAPKQFAPKNKLVKERLFPDSKLSSPQSINDDSPEKLEA